jgi:hypothetical protein
VGRTATVVMREGEKEVLPVVSLFLFFPSFLSIVISEQQHLVQTTVLLL